MQSRRISTIRISHTFPARVELERATINPFWRSRSARAQLMHRTSMRGRARHQSMPRHLCVHPCTSTESWPITSSLGTFEPSGVHSCAIYGEVERHPSQARLWAAVARVRERKSAPPLGARHPRVGPMTSALFVRLCIIVGFHISASLQVQGCICSGLYATITAREVGRKARNPSGPDPGRRESCESPSRTRAGVARYV